MSARRCFGITADDRGERIDVVLARRVPDLSRSRAAELVKAGQVTYRGIAITRAATRLGEDGELAVTLTPREPSQAVAEDVPIQVLYEDRDLLVVDKPAGLVVHPAHGHDGGTLVNALLGHALSLAAGDDPTRPGIVHRIDKDTSGCLVVAKTEPARTGLLKQFRDREVGKTYLAVVHGRAPDEGRIDTSIGRDPANRKRMSVHAVRGRTASSRFRCLERFAGASLLEVEILTGRTHQIRVHLASLGHPLLGDRLYGGAGPRTRAPETRFGRQALHAARLRFRHPVSGRAMALEAPLPEDLGELLERLRKAVRRDTRA